jgi:alpha-tubulin suppressor-like RCC1 family protein
LKGQVGIASNVNTILAPTLVTAFKKNEVPIDISCGDEFSLALVNVTNEVVNEKDTIILFGWGDNHHGQLGAEVSDTCNHPIENRVVTRYISIHIYFNNMHIFLRLLCT